MLPKDIYDIYICLFFLTASLFLLCCTFPIFLPRLGMDFVSVGSWLTILEPRVLRRQPLYLYEVKVWMVCVHPTLPRFYLWDFVFLAISPEGMEWKKTIYDVDNDIWTSIHMRYTSTYLYIIVRHFCLPSHTPQSMFESKILFGRTWTDPTQPNWKAMAQVLKWNPWNWVAKMTYVKFKYNCLLG